MQQLNIRRTGMGDACDGKDFRTAHYRRIEDQLEAGRSVLAHLENVTTYDIGYVEEPDLEQTTTPLRCRTTVSSLPRTSAIPTRCK